MPESVWLNTLECEVTWALGSITVNKASGGDGIPVELFQILKEDAVKVLHSIGQQIWKIAVATGLEKISFHSKPKERQCQRMLKLLHSCTHLIHTSKVMFKILQARFHQYVNHELPDFQAGFRKGRRTRDQIANICWITEKSKTVPEKHLFLLYWLCQSLWLCRSQ